MKQPTIEHLQKEINILKSKNAELDKNKEYYQIITENTSDIIGINTFDLKAEYLYVSPSVKKVLGYEPKELVGCSFFDFIHPDDKKFIFLLLEKYIIKKIKKVLRINNSDETESIEFRFKDKAGNWRYLQSTVNIYSSNLIGITRDISYQKEAEAKLQQRENYLLALNKAKKILLAEFKEDTLQQFVEILGVVSNASRTYIFKNSFNNDGEHIMSQKAEYCVVGIKPEIDNPYLQNMPIDIFGDHWVEMLLSGKVINGKISDFGQNERAYLKSQNINAIIIIPIIIKNELLGIIGFDNCISERKWDNTEQNFLCSAADDFAQFIERTKINFQIRNENKRFQATMDALDAVVYVTDIETYELIYLNKKAKDLVGNKIGKKCYKVLQQGQTKPCDFCTNNLLLDKNGNPKKPHVWEFKNTISKQWHQLSDQAMRWPDGRMVRLEIAVDISERKKIEEELRHSEDNLNEAQHIAKIGSWRHEISNNKLSWSGEVYNIFNIDKDEAESLYDIFFETIHPDDREFLFKSYNESVESKIPYNIIHRLLLKNGTIKYVNERCKTYYNYNDEPTHSIGTVQDITDRKLTEDRLKESEERYRIIAEQKGQMVYSYNIPKGIIAWFGDIQGVTGYTIAEFDDFNISKWENSIHPDEREIAISLLDNAMAKNEKYEVEYRFKDKNGIYIYIEDIGTFLCDEYGKVYQMFGVMKDITERKLVEGKLQESESRFEALSKATNEAIIFIENGVIIEINESACNMSGYAYNEFIGKLATDFISNKSIELVKQNMITEYDKPYDAIAVRKDGSEFHAEVQGRMFNYKGRRIRISSLRDITERKKYETLLKENADKLKELNTKLTELVKTEVEKNRERDHLMIMQSKQAAMGEMISNIAHQWRQPLNDIGLYIQNLQDSYQFDELTAEELNSTVKKTMNKIEYMSQTIDDFRNFYRSDKKKVQFSITDSIDNTLILTDATFVHNSIEVIIDLRKNISILGYPNEFSQVILNILNNAKDAFIENRTTNRQVKIALSKNSKKTTLVISNNAGTIPEIIIDKIFEPYFTTKPNLTGTGLGLYISKTIIERNMQGKLTARNKNDWVEFVIEFDY